MAYNRSGLSEVGLGCGYTVISNRALTVIEIAGNGNWEQFEKACRRFVSHRHNGHSYDHFSVIVRDALGNRELRDVGMNGVRHETLPSVAECAGYSRQPSRNQPPSPHRYSVTETPGVAVRDGRYRVQAHGFYVGVFETYVAAVEARKRAVGELMAG
jgi:hypothetical protein